MKAPKEDRKLTKEEEHTFLDLSLIQMVKKMNWQIAMPEGGGPEDDGNLHGMIIGEESYVDYILKHLE